MQSVDGDVRLSVKLDTKTILSSADELRKAFKEALSAASSVAGTQKSFDKLNTIIHSIIDNVQELQGNIKQTGDIVIETNAQQSAEETEKLNTAVEEVQTAAESAAESAENLGETFTDEMAKSEEQATRTRDIMREIEEEIAAHPENFVVASQTETGDGTNVLGETLAEIEQAADNATQTIQNDLNSTTETAKGTTSIVKNLFVQFARNITQIYPKRIAADLSLAAKHIASTSNAARSSITSASERISQFNHNILNSVKALIQHAKASKSAKNGMNTFNSVIKKGVSVLLKYGLGIRSTYILFNKLKSAIQAGYKNLGGYSDEVNKSISSTLSALEKLKNQLAAAFEPIVTVVVPVLNNMIAKLTEAAFALAQFFAAFTGSATVYKAADVQKKYVEDTKKEVKELERYLSPLDDLNVYKDPNESKKDSDEIDPKTMFTTVGAESKYTELADKIKSAFNEIFQPIENSWNKYGEKVIEKVKGTFDSLLSTIEAVRSSFKTVWTNGTGEETVNRILQIFININEIITNISDNFRSAWNSGAGLSIVQKIADTFNIVLGHIGNITEKTAEWSKEINFEPVLNSLDKILTPLQGIIDLAGEWTEKVWEKVFLPFAGWAIEEAVSAALDAVGGALELIKNVGEKAGEILEFLWDGFFSKAAEWIGDKIVSFLEILGQFLTDVANNDAAVTAIIAIGTAILTIVTAIETLNVALAIADVLSQPLLILPTLIAVAIAAVIVVIIEVITYWDTLKQIFSEGTQWWGNLFSDWWNTIVTYWSDKLLKIVEWFKTVIASFKEFIGDVKVYWGNLFKNLWNSVKNWWNNTFIAGWKSALATVKNTFSNMWDGIKGLTKNAVNTVIGWINSLLSGIVDKINNVLSMMNNLSFDIPEWLGGGTFGFNIQMITAPQIPKLAQGAVIPPNREFLAVLGDQKSGNNVEAPEGLIRKIIREEMANNSGGRYEIPLILGKREVTRLVIDGGKVIMGQTGRNPFELT